MSAPELLSVLASRGVTLWREGDSLRYRAPASMAAGLPALLKAHKSDLLAALVAMEHQEPRSTPAPSSISPEVLSSAEAEDRVERYDERAGIHEHDGKLPPQEAEAQARQAVFQGRHPYYFRLAEAPEMSPVFITHAATVEEARQELAARFGEARVIAVWPVGKREGTP